jgi:hypothetical protein
MGQLIDQRRRWLLTLPTALPRGYREYPAVLSRPALQRCFLSRRV